MDDMIAELRRLLSANKSDAAVYFIKCSNYLDETERIVAKIPSYSSRSTTPCRVLPVEGVRLSLNL